MTPARPTPASGRLRQICNLWTLWHHPPAARKWSTERKLAEIRDAGFDGFHTAVDARRATQKSRSTFGDALSTLNWSPLLPPWAASSVFFPPRVGWQIGRAHV